MELNTWEIKIKNDREKTLNIIMEEFCNIHEFTKIYFWLDINKKEYTIFEKLIYDIAVFHFKRLGLDINDKKYFIECWTHYRSSNDHCLHIDIDETEYEKNDKLCLPFLTTLTYFNNTKNPTMILDVTEEQYSKKDYKNHDAYFVFPKMLKHLSFYGHKYYHGAIKYFDDKEEKNNRYILGMNFWEKPLVFVEKYNFNIYKNHPFRFKNLYYINKNYDLFEFEEKNNVKTIQGKEDILKNLHLLGSHNKEFFIRSITVKPNEFKDEFGNLIKETDLSGNDIIKIFI